MLHRLRNLWLAASLALVAGAALVPVSAGPGAAQAAPAGPFVAFLPLLAADDTPSAETIAGLFFDAWLAEDDDALALYGELSAIAHAQSFAISSGWAFSNCEGAAGSVFCTWVSPGERVRLRVNNIQPPRLVTDFQFAELTSEEAAHELFDAWRAGSDDAVRALSEPAAADAALALSGRAADAWIFDRCEGAAGSLFCTWRRGASALMVRVVNIQAPHLVTGFTVQG